MKREIFIVADHSSGGRFPDTEAGLMARLDSDEQFILEHHPNAASEPWRALAKLSSNSPRDGMAARLYERLLALRAALRDESVPRWGVALAAVAYQDMVLIYRQPGDRSAVSSIQGGRAKGKPKPSRVSLATLVFRSISARVGTRDAESIRDVVYRNNWESVDGRRIKIEALPVSARRADAKEFRFTDQERSCTVKAKDLQRAITRALKPKK